MDAVNDLPWVQRDKKIRAVTLPIMRQLELDDRWELTRPPTLEEDKKGIDHFVKIKNIPELEKFAGKEVPVQFKVRSKAKYQDLIVARFQPFHGIDQEILSRSQSGLAKQTADGRDWRGLMDSVSKIYFVATMNAQSEFDEVSFVTSKNLKKHVINLDKEWEECEREGKIKPKGFFTCETIEAMLRKNPIKDRGMVFYNSEGDEIWYQKNRNESPKFLMYIANSRRTGHCTIDPVELLNTKNELKKQGLI